MVYGATPFGACEKGSGEDVCVKYYLLAVPVKKSYAQTPPTRGEGLVSQVQMLGLAEVLEPCN